MNKLASALGLAKGDISQEVLLLKHYLRKFGYLQETPPEKIGSSKDLLKIFDDQTEAALKEFQHFYGLAETGVLDKATIDLMSKPRCGVPDKLTATDQLEYSDTGYTWTSNSLTYAFQNFCTDLTQQQCRDAVSVALTLWSRVTPLFFSEVTIRSNPNITIRFVAGAHGECAPFDGPSKILAHAYFPPPGGGDLSGDVHFDEAETWTVDIPVPAGGVDLVNIAAHELGHSLGLDHSADESSLMYAYYLSNNVKRGLTEDDIKGIRSKYGAEGVNKVGSIGQSGWPGVWSNIDAALIHPVNGKAYFFKGNQYQRFNFNSPEQVDKVGIIGQSGWPGVWSNIDAALIHPVNGKAYFFKGNQYQRFNFNSPEQVDKVGTIGQSGWPDVWSDLDAGLIHPRNQRAYFFRGSEYQRFQFSV